MVRKLLVVISALVLVGGAVWFFLGDNISGAQPAANNGAKQQAAAPASTQAGGPASQAPANGEFWTKRCNTEGEKYCEIFQRLTIKENNQRLIEFAVGYPKEAKGTAQAAIILPLGVMVSEGIALRVDEEAPAKASYRLCIPDGCLVVMNLPDSFVSSMSKGEKITVSFLDGSGKQLNVEMSLKGFGAKVAEVK